MATRTKPRSAKKTPTRAKSKRAAETTRSPAKRSLSRRKAVGKGRRASAPGKRGAKSKRKSARKAAVAHARAAGVKPVGGAAKSAASGRMHRVTRGRTKELSAPKPRPAGATRQQRKKATGEQGFGFKQIEERYTAPGKTGVAAERRESVREVDEELEVEGVGQGKPAAGFVDYDKQERTPDEAEEEGAEKVDFVAPVEEE
jgi:hypothetical protein